MFQDIKQFVPSVVCLSCEGCCRFWEKNSPWRPKISKEEILGIIKLAQTKTIGYKEKIDSGGRIKTVSQDTDTHHFCSFFEPETNTCVIYKSRPFECCLYPFVLAKKNNHAVLVIHHHCPFIQGKRSTAEFNQYVEYLKEFFKQEKVLNFLKRNPTLLGNYPDDSEALEYLFTIT